MKPSPAAEEPGLHTGLALLGLASGLHLAGWAALALGGRLSAWLLVPALATAVALGAVACEARPGRRRMQTAARLLVAVALVTGVALAASACFFDVSWDGQVYHQEAVLALTSGWNPLHDGPLPLSRPDNIWINHYPKGVWIAQAILFQATSSLEAAKGLQLVVALAAGLLAHATLRARNVPPVAAVVLAALLAANPVALAQAFSFYVDGLTASLLLALLALALHPRGQSAWPSLLGQAAALVLLVNTKFTSVIYALVLLGGLVLLFRLLARRPVSRFALVGGAAVAFGVLGAGYDPYLTNWSRHGHPFYPVMGAQAVDFLSIQLDPTFHQRSRLQRLAIATFARASNLNQPPRLKLPGTVAGGELAAFAYADLRMGGFGPLWGLIIMMAATLSLALLSRRWARPVAALGALVVASALINPACWWARYVPQLWLLPVGLAAALAARGGVTWPLWQRRLNGALVALLVLDVGLVGFAAAGGQWRASRAVAGELAALATGDRLAVRFDGFESNRARLAAFGIPFAETDPLPCPHPRRLFGSRAQVCPPPAAVVDLRGGSR